MLVETVRFAYENLLTRVGVAVTSSSEQADYPDDFALHPGPWKVFRSVEGTGGPWWKADLGSNLPMNCALIRGWGRPGNSALRFQAHTADSWGAPAIDVAFTLPADNPTGVIAVFFALQSLRWVRFYAPNASAVEGYLELAVPFVGTYFEPENSARVGVGLPLVDPSTVIYSPDGQALVHTRSRYAAFSAQFLVESATERNRFFTMYRTAGVRTPVFFALDPSTPDLILYGRFPSQFTAEHNEESDDVWTFDVPFQEER